MKLINLIAFYPIQAMLFYMPVDLNYYVNNYPIRELAIYQRKEEKNNKKGEAQKRFNYSRNLPDLITIDNIEQKDEEWTIELKTRFMMEYETKKFKSYGPDYLYNKQLRSAYNRALRRIR